MRRGTSSTGNRTKIVATLGPASRSPGVVGELVEAGVDVARINYAHGDPTEHAATVATVKTVGRGAGRSVGVLADLPGPKMRSGELAEEEVYVEAGRPFVLSSKRELGGPGSVSTTVGDLPRIVDAGDRIYLADGAIVLEVRSSDDSTVTTEVIRGGVLRSRKGMHIPGAERKLQAFTEEDERALAHALDAGADLIGLSFVRDAGDIARARKSLPEGRGAPMLVAKIETRAALEDLDSIIYEADAVMVARGDLGIQLPLEDVPILQKEIIRACNLAGKPAITATHMLESMTHAPLPTRAEANDVANAVLDGTDAVMLSEETAVGDHPVAAVTTMNAIARAAEASAHEHVHPGRRDASDQPVAWAVARAAVAAAEDLGVAAIITPTRIGTTARKVAAFRPTMPLIAVTWDERTSGMLALVWGVTPLLVSGKADARDAQEVIDHAVGQVVGAGLIAKGALAAVVSGSPGRVGGTDFLRIVRA